MSAAHISKLHKMLNSDCYDFLIYFGGSGGDTICHLINQYSKKYKDCGVLISGKNNRFMYHKGFCYSEFKKIGISDDISPLVDAHKMFENLVADATLVQACADIDIWYNLFRADYRFLIKMHSLPHPKHRTNSKKFIIYPDSEYWREYTIKMRALKVDLDEILLPDDLINRQEFLSQFISDWHPYVSSTHRAIIINDILELGIKKFYNVYSTLIRYPFYDKKLFSLSEYELISTLSMHGLYDASHILDWTNSLYNPGHSITELEDSGYTIVPMSKMFDYTFMQPTFDIVNSEFSVRLNAWHQKNLELLARYNFR